MQFFVAILSLQLALRIEFLFSETEKNKKLVTTKGQLISKFPYGVIVWTKIPTKNTF